MCGLLHFKCGYCVSIFSGCSDIFFLTAGCSRDDAVYDELQKADGDRKSLPVDEDLPGMGQYYCLHCDRYFAKVAVRDEHFKTKRHKKRLKQMMGPAPHTQLDADLAAGMGMPDNGPKLMST
ncbi:UNVERIFIED_CONTAM: Zinc finger protein [Sesamum angustifolium]|uniref:Zinc finger protein n=1 Tax=Sesamum angustifolium TaxID=2727405 RepID=A0AAW2N7Q8_9LAMI